MILVSGVLFCVRCFFRCCCCCLRSVIIYQEDEANIWERFTDILSLFERIFSSNNIVNTETYAILINVYYYINTYVVLLLFT